MALEPINANTILTTSDPVPVTDINVPGWVVVETMEITFGDYTGRPDVEHVQLAREMLAFFFEQGWYIVAVVSAASGGQWESVAEDKGTSIVSTEETGKAKSESEEKAESGATNEYRSHYYISSDGNGGGTGDSSGASAATSVGTTTAKGGSESSESKTEEKTSQGARKTASEAYWASWQKVRMQRKRIHPRKVLESMVAELVTSYKEGEKAVSERYSAVVALYTTMLSRTENEIGDLEGEVASFKATMSDALSSIKDTLGKLSLADDEKVNEAAEYQRKTINEKFDALIATEKGRLISAGLFNSTQWTMVAAGIERERGVALLAVSDKILGWERDFATAAASLAPALAAAARTTWDVGKEAVFEPTKMRNEVLKWMLDYAERHNTERAKVSDIAQLPRVLDGIAGGYAEKD